MLTHDDAVQIARMLASAAPAALLGRASGGWDPVGWAPPGDRFWMRLWALWLGIAAAVAHGSPWLLCVASLAYLSRVEQTRWHKTCQTISGAAGMAAIGVLQAAAVVVPVAVLRLDPWVAAWVLVGLVRGALYYGCWSVPLPAKHPPRSLVDDHTAYAELGWYAVMGALAASPL